MPSHDLESLRNLSLDTLIPQLWGVGKIVSDGQGWHVYHLIGSDMQVSVLPNGGGADGWIAWDRREDGVRVNSRGASHGRGALNLVVAVDGCSLSDAIDRLEILNPQAIPSQPKRTIPESKPFTFPRITFNAAQEWTTIQRYLVGQRELPESLVKKAWQAHQIHVGWGTQSAGYLLFPQRAWDQTTTNPHGPAPVGCAWRWADDQQVTRKLKVRQSGPRPGTKGSEQLDPRTTGWWQLGIGREAVIAVESGIDGLAFFASAGSLGKRFTVVAGHGQGGFSARAWRGFPLVGVATDGDSAGDGYAQEITRQTSSPVIRILPPEGTKDWAEAWQVNPAQARRVAQEGLHVLFTHQKHHEPEEREQ